RRPRGRWGLRPARAHVCTPAAAPPARGRATASWKPPLLVLRRASAEKVLNKMVAVKRLLALIALAGCRSVIGIDDLPPRTDTDAGPEAAGPDAGPRFCDTVTPKPELCADFDDDGPLEAMFDNAKIVPDPGVAGGGSIAPDLELFQSTPRSVRMTADPVLVG